MAGIISVLLFAFLVIAITAYGYYRFAKPGRLLEQLGSGTTVSAIPTIIEVAPSGKTNPIITIIQRVGEKVPVSPQDVSMARRYLIAAGYKSDAAVPVYYGIRIISAVVLLIIALAGGGYVVKGGVLSILLPCAATFAGWFLPSLVLDRLVRRRQEELRLSLPDALDMMVICVEAGVGLDQALARVAQELAITHKDISEEFSIVNLEMRAGKRRTEALQNLADRTGVADIRRLVAILVQTDRFGTSMAESLRTHSDFMRVKRRQEAEERAGKIGVKLVFPIFFCIMPSMMLVAAGPGILQVVKYLFPMMRSFQG